MANQTITADADLTTVETGLNNGQNITINNGAVLTVSTSPTKLIGQVNINEGEFFIDGENATNPIIMIGENVEEVNVNGAGTLRSSLGWWIAPGTGDGTADQTFDISTYFTDGLINADVFAGVWVETGRRIVYDTGSGVAPQVNDWLFMTADQNVHGRIIEVVGDASSGYLVVNFLTGAIPSGNTPIEIHSIQDNNGPDYQISWTADTIGLDVLEADVWYPFGNAFQNSIDGLPSLYDGLAGFGFSQAYQSNTLTFGDGVNGNVVPNGARIRIPMIHWATSSTTAIASNESTVESASSRYELETVNGGDCFLAGISFGTAYFEDSLGGQFEADYCTAFINLGVYAALSRTRYNNVIICADFSGDIRSAGRSIPPIVDMVNGADVTDCFILTTNDTAETGHFGCQTSRDVTNTRCHYITSAVGDWEVLRSDNYVAIDCILIGEPVRFNTATNSSINLMKFQRRIDGTVGGGDQIILQYNSSAIRIIGLETIKHSRPDDSFILISDSSDIKVFGYHFAGSKFDNEFLGGTQGEEFVSISGFSFDIQIARCWQDRGAPNEFAIVTPGTVFNVVISNCSAEYSGEVQPSGINVSFRGIHGGNGSLGADTGFETDYPGTAGCHFADIFESDTSGYIAYRNVPGTDDWPIAVLSGNPIFTKDGDVDVKSGDQWEVDMGYVALGHTSFTGAITTTRNGSQAVEGADNWTAVDIDFQFDTGSGYNGIWLDLRTPSNLTAITGTVDGVRLKLRFTGTATQTNGQALTIQTLTTIADQLANLHPIDQNVVDLTFSGLQTGTELRVYRVSDDIEIAGVENSGSLFSFNYTHSGSDIDVYVVIHALSYLNQRLLLSLGASDTTIPIQQTFDRQYDNP